MRSARLLNQVNRIREANPMLGFRGCRLGLLFPEVTRMQCRAIFEAACQVQGETKKVELEIMVPLVSLSEELQQQREVIHEVARQVMGEHGMTIEYRVGTMIELPRAALMADDIAAHADFFSFGTNDLTQTTFGLSRDDSAASCRITSNARFCLTILFRCSIATAWANWCEWAPSVAAA